MEFFDVILALIGLLGIVTFVIDLRKKRLKWYDYLFLAVSVALIGEVIWSVAIC